MASDKKDRPANNKTLHITMQGKGGAGKSFVASLIAQTYQEKNLPYLALDLDPINRTLSGVKGITNVEKWDITHEGTTSVNPKRFDELIDKIIATDTDIIIDTGATNFMSFNEYLAKFDMLKKLNERMGIQTKIHCVLRAGSSRDDCVHGLAALCETHTSPTSIVAWLNEVEGPIVSNEGKTFEEFGAYTKYQDRIEAINRIPKQNDELYRDDMEMLLTSRLTFDEAIKSEQFGFASKMRLEQLKDYYTSAFAVA